MKKFIVLVLCCLTFAVSAGVNGTRISNLKCNKNWVRAGSTKLEVISWCGVPKYSTFVPSGRGVLVEQVLYTIKRKDYIIFISNGAVSRIEMVK